MAKGFEKMQIKSAVKSRSTFDLDHTHSTTIDFGQICILNRFYGIPGDSAQYKYSAFGRVSPLNFPVYGNCSLRTVNFFVPYFQVADEIEGFFSGQPIYHGVPTSIRYTTLNDIMLMFTSNSGSTNTGLTVSGSGPTSEKPGGDFNMAIISSRDSTGSPTFNYYKLTSKGRYVYKILRQLGYDFPANVDLSRSSSSSTYLSRKLNLLPLLCFFKAYNDWMTNSTRFNDSVLTKYLEAIRFKDDSVKLSDGQTSVVGKNGAIPFNAIVEMFDQVRLLYDSDYFTSAWRFPNSPYSSSADYYNPSSINLSDDLGLNAQPPVAGQSYGFGTVSYGSYSTQSRMTTSDPTLAALSVRQLNFLRAFDNWVRRNNYAGSRAVNQIYSRFGIKPQEFRAQYAELISKDSIPLRVGDVTQTSQTTPDHPLGSYVGKGITNGEHGVSYKFGDYGVLFTLGYIWVDPVYYRGFDREVLKVDTLDFYNPEFDSVGPEAISMLELYNDPKSVIKGLSGSISYNDGNVTFGFTERYNDMRFQRDQITGDFELYDELKPWHFGRDLDYVRRNGYKAQSDSVVYYTPTEKGDYEYDRIFAVTQTSEGNPIEHFYLQCQFTGSASRPMKNISQAADLGDGELTIDRLGQQVN